MIERDYIMRMITMLTAVIAKVMHLKYAKEFPQALREVDRGLRSLLGLDGKGLDAFDEDQLVEMFGRDPEMAPVRWYALGVLLMEREDLLPAGEERGGGHHSRPLRMLLEGYLAVGAELEPGHLRRIDELMGRLTAGELSDGTLLRAADYHELAGRFAKAEDAHWELLERAPGQTEHVVGFYKRLLQRSDAELESGDLPRSEVLDGLEKARARVAHQDGR